MTHRTTLRVILGTADDLVDRVEHVLDEQVAPALVELLARNRVGEMGVLSTGELRAVARGALEDLEAANGPGLSPQFVDAAARLAAAAVLMLAARATRLDEQVTLTNSPASTDWKTPEAIARSILVNPSLGWHGCVALGARTADARTKNRLRALLSRCAGGPVSAFVDDIGALLADLGRAG